MHRREWETPGVCAFKKSSKMRSICFFSQAEAGFLFPLGKEMKSNTASITRVLIQGSYLRFTLQIDRKVYFDF